MAKLEFVYTASDGKVYKSVFLEDDERPAIEVGNIQENLDTFAELIFNNGLCEDDIYRVIGSYEDYIDD